MSRSVKTEEPGEPEAAEQPKASPAAAAKRHEDVDPSKIPFGQTVLTDKGLVCSTAPDPRIPTLNR